MNGDLKNFCEKILSDLDQNFRAVDRDPAPEDPDKVLKKIIADSKYSDRMYSEFFSIGPLEQLVVDECVTEIIVNGPDDIWYEKSGLLSKHNDSFLSGSTFRNFVDRVCAVAEIKIDLAKPFADGRWLSFRVHIVCAPISDRSFHLSFRRIATSPWTLQALVNVGWATRTEANRIEKLIADRCSLAVVGPTGSGKTAVLGALLRQIAPSERAVVIEDTDELPSPNFVSSKLLTREWSTETLPIISLQDLVRQSLRMRPDRIVVGEVRGAEAKDLLLALATGHRGSMCTLHATEARQSLLRLEMMIQMGAPQWNLQAVRQLIHLSLEYLIVCDFKNGVRRLEGIYRIAALESFGFLVERLDEKDPCQLHGS